jgi:chaperonin cofactor prefoldin
MASVDDWDFEPPTEMDELRKEVKALMIYVKTLSEMERNTNRRLNTLISALKKRGFDPDDAD